MASKTPKRARVDASRGASWVAAACAACGVSDASLPVDFGALGDGSEPVPSQAVLSLEVSDATPGSACPATLWAELPDDTASATLAGTSGNGQRSIDGSSVDGQVTHAACRVSPIQSEPGTFDVSLRLQQPRLDFSFEATGNLRAAPSQLLAVRVVALTHVLAEGGCEVEVDTIVSGAVWLREIRCPNLSNADEPALDRGARCSASGAAIFENCSR